MQDSAGNEWVEGAGEYELRSHAGQLQAVVDVRAGTWRVTNACRVVASGDAEGDVDGAMLAAHAEARRLERSSRAVMAPIRARKAAPKLDDFGRAETILMKAKRIRADAERARGSVFTRPAQRAEVEDRLQALEADLRLVEAARMRALAQPERHASRAGRLALCDAKAELARAELDAWTAKLPTSTGPSLAEFLQRLPAE